MTSLQVAAIGYRMIQMIRLLHDKGIAHNNVRDGFVYTDVGNRYETLRLVQFEGAVPFMDPESGQHIESERRVDDWWPFEVTGIPSGLNSSLYQLQNQDGRYSRRDDIFSIAEMLIDMLEPRPSWWVYEEPEHWMALKRNRKLSGIPIQLQALYDYSKQLEFSERPDYHRILTMLKEIV